MPGEPNAPIAEKRPRERTVHGETVLDDYYWLRDRDDPAVIKHLEAENVYTEAVTAHLEPLRDAIFDEVKAAVVEDDESVPARRGEWWYSTRTIEGRPYPIHLRRRTPESGGSGGSAQARPSLTGAAVALPGAEVRTPESGHMAEEIVIDENELAAGHDFFALGALEISEDGLRAVYATDTEGDEEFVLRVRDLGAAGADGAHVTDLADTVPAVSYGAAWSASGSHIFYTTYDDAHRPWRVHRHEIGTAPGTDAVVFEDPDERFHVDLGKSRDGRHIVIECHSAVTSEALLIPADDPTADPLPVAPRRQGVEYSAEPAAGEVWILANDAGANFRLCRAPVTHPGPEHWVEVIAARDDTRLDDVDVFAGRVVVWFRRGGLPGVLVYTIATGESVELDFPDGAYDLGPGANLEFDTPSFRFVYRSLATPDTTYEYEFATGSKTVLKRAPVRGYDPDRYDTDRLWATAPDGTMVPISIVHRRGLERDGSHPCLLYGYGSYEMSIDPTFSALRLPLLERGVVFAIAHVRGGGEMGRHWYEDGKFLRKTNTFTDFIACAEHLIDLGYTSPARLAARGRSAGGLLAGAVANLRPELFCAVSAEVPFVDVVNTMLDPDIPLTVIEWEEWGNPVESAEFYQCMRSYAPYENVAAADYPAMFVNGGLNDPRVAYWEPAKFVARLREVTTGPAPIVLRMEMGAGHRGPSGRYPAWREEAFTLAFLLDQMGVAR